MRIIDQRELPAREAMRDLGALDDVCHAIETLAVRGAPAIGIAGAMGLVVSVLEPALRARVRLSLAVRRPPIAIAQHGRPR